MRSIFASTAWQRWQVCSGRPRQLGREATPSKCAAVLHSQINLSRTRQGPTSSHSPPAVLWTAPTDRRGGRPWIVVCPAAAPIVGSCPTATRSSASSGPTWPNKYDKWAERRYLGLGALKNARAVLTTWVTDRLPEEVRPHDRHRHQRLTSITVVHHHQGLDPRQGVHPTGSRQEMLAQPPTSRRPRARQSVIRAYPPPACCQLGTEPLC